MNISTCTALAACRSYLCQLLALLSLSAVQWTSDFARLTLVLVKVTVYRSGTAVTATGAAATTAVAGLSRCYGVVQCSGFAVASASLSVGTVLCSVAGLLLPPLLSDP